MTDAESSRFKVGDLIEKYGLKDTGSKLEIRWTRDDDRWSLRDLADWFNQQVLEQAMADAEIQTVDGEVDNLYRLLTSDAVSSGNRTEARQRLRQNGIDIGQLEQDFVTYQAVRSYLKEYRDATYDRDDDATDVDSVIDTIQRLVSRTRSVVQKSIDQLNNTGQISIGEYRLFVNISVLCEDCNTQYEIADLLQNEGCECRSPASKRN